MCPQPCFHRAPFDFGMTIHIFLEAPGSGLHMLHSFDCPPFPSIHRHSSTITAQDPLDARTVSFAEEIQMDEQIVQLIERFAVLVAGA